MQHKVIPTITIWLYTFFVLTLNLAAQAEMLIARDFLAAKKLLAEGQADKSYQLLKQLSSTPQLKQWSNIYMAEALLLKRQYTESEKLLSIQYYGLRKPLSELLKLELKALQGKKIDGKLLNSFENSYSSKINLELRAKLIYLKAILANQNNNILEAINLLHKARSIAPLGLSAYKARLFQNILVSQTALLQDRNYLLKEISLLRKQNHSEEAFDLLEQKLVPLSFHDTISYKEFLQEKIQTLKSLKKVNQIKELLEANLNNPKKEIRDFAKEELGVLAWQKNQYSEATAYLRSLSTVRAKYALARINEEQGYFQKALELYQSASVLNSPDNEQYAALALIRYLPLQYLADKNKKELFNSSSINGLSLIDQEMLSFWENDGKKISSTSYYNFINRNNGIFKPVAPIKPNKACSKTPYTISESSKNLILSLNKLGLHDLAADELNFILPTNIDPLRKGLTLQQLGLYSAAIIAIASQPFNFEKQCGAQLLKLSYPKPYLQTYQKFGKQYAVDPMLLLAISRSESLFNSAAISRTGALGLMQLMPNTAMQEGLRKNVTDSLNVPATNIAYGSKHFAKLLKRYDGKVYLAVAAYNAGVQAVDLWLKRIPDTWPQIWIELIPYKETRDYVRKVLGTWAVYQASSEVR